MRNCIDKWFLFLLMAVICFLLFDNVRLRNIGDNWQIHHTDTITNTDTVWKDTMIIKTKLIPKYEYLIRVDTVYDKEGKEIELRTENKTYQDTIECARDTAILTNYISGVNAKLDSFNLQWKKSEITNTIEITKYIEKKKTFIDRFHVGVQAGYGYTFNSKELQPYIGLGGSIDL